MFSSFQLPYAVELHLRVKAWNKTDAEAITKQVNLLVIYPTHLPLPDEYIAIPNPVELKRYLLYRHALWGPYGFVKPKKTPAGTEPAHS